MERKVVLFEQAGAEKTAACVEVVRELVADGYRRVVVASTVGSVARAMAKELADTDAELLVVTHSAGFREPSAQEFDESLRKKLEAQGITILTATILTHSLETAFSAEFGGSMPTHIIANTLRRHGQGTKVACEIVMEACDAGLLPEGEPVVAVAGSGRGADTVCVIKSAASKRFLNLQVMWTAAKPLSW